MKKKILTLTLFATASFSSIAFAATLSPVQVPQGMLNGYLQQYGSQGAAASTTLTQINGKQKAYVYLQTKASNGAELNRTQDIGDESSSKSVAYITHSHPSAKSFWSTHRALSAGTSDAKSLSLNI